MLENDIKNKFGVPISVSENDEMIFYCPYCIENVGKPDLKGHLSANSVNGLWHCFRCGASGKIGKGDDIYNSSGKPNSLSEILKNIKLILEPPEIDIVNQYIIPIDDIFSNATAYQYMKDRGFNDEELRFYEVRAGSLFKHDEYGRVIVPNKVTRLVYTDMYIARTYLNDYMRYINPKGKNSSVVVFNLFRIPKGNKIIICEGVFDAMASGKNSVALFGKTCSELQLNKILANKPKEIIVNLDKDAEKESCQLCDKIQSKSNIVVKNVIIDHEKYKDAADFKSAGKISEYLEIIESTKEYSSLISKFNKLIKS